MRYPAPELLELTPAQVQDLKAHPCCYNVVGASHAPEALQFQFDYAPSGATPPAPLPVLMLTLFIQQGAYALNLGLVQTAPEYNSEHDDPVSSPLLARSVYISLMGQIRVLLPLPPHDPELLRPIKDVLTTPAMAQSAEPMPEDNVVAQDLNPNAMMTPRAVLTATSERPLVADPYRNEASGQPATTAEVVAAAPHPSLTSQGVPTYPASTQGEATHGSTVVVTPAEQKVMSGPVEYAGMTETTSLALEITTPQGEVQQYDWSPIFLPTAAQAIEHVQQFYKGPGTLRVYRHSEYYPGVPQTAEALVVTPLPYTE